MTPWEIAGQARGWLEAGGPVVAVLLAMSVFALAVVLLKLYQFRRARIRDRAPVREALRLHRSGQGGLALDVLATSPNPVAEVLALAIRGHGRHDLDQAAVREELARVAARRLAALRGGLRPLEAIGSLAPLLGLFGTVLGMIEAFRQLERAGMQVNPAVLSGGIWEALLTTAVGLAVAIPTVAGHGWIEHRVDGVADWMEDAVSGAFTVDLGAPAVGASSASAVREPADHAAVPVRVAD